MKKQTTGLLIFCFTLVGLVAVCTPLVDGQTTVPAPAPSPKVTAVEGHLELDDVVRIQIDHLAEWAATNNPLKLVPYINGRAIRGNYPVEIHALQNHVHFHLQILPENKNVWVDLLGAPTGSRRPVVLSVGLEDQTPFDSVFDQRNTVLLTVISPVYGFISLLTVLITLIVFLWLVRTTNLIREPGPQPVGGKLCQGTVEQFEFADHGVGLASIRRQDVRSTACRS